MDIEGLDLKAVRDKQLQIDLLELTKKPEDAPATGKPPAPSAKAPAPAPAPALSTPPAKAEPEFKIAVAKVTLKGGATFTDEAVSAPPTVLRSATCWCSSTT